MGGAAQATLARPSARSALETGAHGAQPKGLGSALPQAPHVPVRASLRRMWTMVKPGRGGDVSCNVLPFLLDISLSLFDTLDLVKSSVDSEVVFQATLQVPAHHALTCRVQAYGTPFAAPDLQATANQLTDEDLEFAACLASPPDLDEQLSVNFGRVMSLLEHNKGGAAGAVTRAAPAGQHTGPQNSAATGVQQMRTPQLQQQQAPKVLVSVDDAEAGTAQLQRSNSEKKPRVMSMAESYSKRAMQALLGFGYLLTVLHEKHLGGHVQFTAAALTAAGSATPSMSKNIRQKRSSSSSGSGLMAGLRKMVAECPSLNPSFESFQWRSPQAAAAAGEGAALAAALGGSSVLSNAQLDQLRSFGCRSSNSNGSGLCNSKLLSAGLGSAPSFEAAWDRINGVAPTPAHRQWQEHQQQQQQQHPGDDDLCRGLQVQLSMSAPLRGSRSTSIEEYAEQLQGRQQEKQAWDSAAEAAITAGLGKAHDTGRGGALDQVMDEAVEQLRQQQRAAAAAAAGGGQTVTAADGSPAELCADVASHFMPDQGALTSPWPARPAAAAAWSQACGSPLLLPSPQHLPAITTAIIASPQPPLSPLPMAATAEADSCMSPAAAGPKTPVGLPPPSPRILRPMMSMRLTCQPRWIATDSVELDKDGQQQQQQQRSSEPAAPQHRERRQAVHMHQDKDQQDWQELQQPSGAAACDRQAIAGLWPTMSFSLVPVRSQPSNVVPGRA